MIIQGSKGSICVYYKDLLMLFMTLITDSSDEEEYNSE